MTPSTLSPAALEARRSNASRSTGPRTAPGKSRSRLNALKHGGYATHVAWSDEALKALGENPAAFRDLVSRIKSAEGPSGDPLWALQIDDLARLYWRRQRLERAWEILAARQAERGEPSELVAVSADGRELLGQLDSVDRSIDRNTRLLLRLREAEARHRRQLQQSARRRVRQQLQQMDFSDDTPTEEDLALQEAELARLKEHNARLERQYPSSFLDDFDEDTNKQKSAERSEEVAENKGSAVENVPSAK